MNATLKTMLLTAAAVVVGNFAYNQIASLVNKSKTALPKTTTATPASA